MLMESKLDKLEKVISKSNLSFVAIALGFFLFWQLIFADLWNGAIKAGQSFPSLFNLIGGALNSAINNPFLYLLACGTYYLISLKYLSTETNKVINYGLLGILIILLFYLYQTYLSTLWGGK